MVVFSAEYWAPGMDNKTTINPVKKHLLKDKPLLHPAIPNSIFSSPACESLSDFGAESKESITLNKKRDGANKLFKNINANLHSSNKGSDDLLSGVKSVWLDMLSTKVSKKHSESSPGSKKEDKTFEKKYGICEKKCIGKGATAVVRIAHKANNLANKETLYAIKEFRKRRKNESEREYVKKLTGEFCISSTLHHANIVETIDLIMDEHKNWCEVMEYCPGGDLYSVIKNGSMTIVEINCCFKQMVFGTEYLHSMGVAHRDIKPENLLITEKGTIKITDFGVSDVFKMAWESNNHNSRGLCGSEPYISPEQFKQKEYDARCVDIWACAIVYYTMVHRSILFKQSTDNDPLFIKYRTCYEKRIFEGFKSYQEGCVDLMYRMLCIDPKNRIKINDIIEHEWFKSIEVCDDCVSSTGYHNHFSSDYVPRR